MAIYDKHVALSVLQPGENLLWSGQPDPQRIAWQTWPIFVIALPWTLYALYWTYQSIGFRMPDFNEPTPLVFFPFIGGFFILIGLSLLALPFLAARRARRTVYAVTDRRCLVIVDGRRKYVTAHTREDIGRIACTERSGGRGDLVFYPSESRAAKDVSRVGISGFYGIDGVRRVEETVRRVFQ